MRTDQERKTFRRGYAAGIKAAIDVIEAAQALNGSVGGIKRALEILAAEPSPDVEKL